MPKKLLPTQRPSAGPTLPRWQVTYLDSIGERGQCMIRATDRTDCIAEFWRIHPNFGICYVGLSRDPAVEAVKAQNLIPNPGEAPEKELPGIVSARGGSK